VTTASPEIVETSASSASIGVRRGATLRIQDLYKQYGAVTAIDGVSLEVLSGEFLTLLGPSGSGKTTTLMTVAGFEVPTSGDVYIDGQAVSRVPPHRRGIGMVFQNYALFPHMTVADNIGFPLRMRKMAKPERYERVRTALSLVRLPGVEDRYPQQLSGGQQQRVALARAIVYDPPLLLMDEPLGALDKQLREQLQIEIKHLQNRLNITVISVTHDQAEALIMSDRIAVFNNGKIEQVGRPEQLYDTPANRFVASFLGESNFLEAEIVGVDGDTCTVRTRGDVRLQVARHADAQAGQQAIVAVRPEKIMLSADASLPNSQQGTIKEVIFEGDKRRYEVRLAGDDSVVLKQTNRQGVMHPACDDTVTIGWHVADGRIVEVLGG